MLSTTDNNLLKWRIDYEKEDFNNFVDNIDFIIWLYNVSIY